jgi:hypothetical protein
MPNHVTNILSFQGDEKNIQALRTAISSIEEDGTPRIIDFKKIIPMPESLNITSGSQVDNGIAVLLFQKGETSKELEKMLSWPWVKSEGITTTSELVDYLIKENRVDLAQAAIALDNVEKYGYKDWYEWSYANWGTKWNAYEMEENEDDKILFNTAWSSPISLIRNLSEMFPDVEISLRFADEDFGHNCGEVTFLSGNAIQENYPEGGSIEAYALAADVKGCDSEEMLWRVCDSEDEKYIGKFLPMLFAIFGAVEIVNALEHIDADCMTQLFLDNLKSTLIELEEYESIEAVDNKIAELQNMGEE